MWSIIDKIFLYVSKKDWGTNKLNSFLKLDVVLAVPIVSFQLYWPISPRLKSFTYLMYSQACCFHWIFRKGNMLLKSILWFVKGKATTIIYCFNIDLVALGNSLQDVLTILQKSSFSFCSLVIIWKYTLSIVNDGSSAIFCVHFTELKFSLFNCGNYFIFYKLLIGF